METKLKAAREARQWSQLRLLSELIRRGHARGMPMPSHTSLKTAISRWENGHHTPQEPYRALFAEIYETTPSALGLGRCDESELPAVDQLRTQLDLRSDPDLDLEGLLRLQTEAIRRQDRQFGAGALLEQMRGHVANVQQHLAHAVFDAVRRPLSVLLADAAALAGWQALDLGALDHSWRFFETAIRAAHEARDPALLAFARVEQAHVILELGNPATAAQLSQAVWDEAEDHVSRGMRCWLAAAAGELHAAAGDRLAARTMLRKAEADANSTGGELPPYVVFNEAHLDRWIGHSLVLMGDSAAEEPLRRAAEEMDPTFARARAALEVDLACVLRGVENDEAEEHLQRAEALATKVRSRRQLDRVHRLRLAGR